MASSSIKILTRRMLATPCDSATVMSCTAQAHVALADWNREFDPLDDLSLGTEYHSDEEGRRTGFKNRYHDIGVGLQHWFLPQIQLRPESTHYHALDANAVNTDPATGYTAQGKNHQMVVSGDVFSTVGSDPVEKDAACLLAIPFGSRGVTSHGKAGIKRQASDKTIVTGGGLFRAGEVEQFPC